MWSLRKNSTGAATSSTLAGRSRGNEEAFETVFWTALTVILRFHAPLDPGGFPYFVTMVGSMVVLPLAAAKYVGQPPNARVRVSRRWSSSAASFADYKLGPPKE